MSSSTGQGIWMVPRPLLGLHLRWHCCPKVEPGLEIVDGCCCWLLLMVDGVVKEKCTCRWRKVPRRKLIECDSGGVFDAKGVSCRERGAVSINARGVVEGEGAKGRRRSVLNDEGVCVSNTKSVAAPDQCGKWQTSVVECGDQQSVAARRTSHLRSYRRSRQFERSLLDFERDRTSSQIALRDRTSNRPLVLASSRRAPSRRGLLKPAPLIPPTDGTEKNRSYRSKNHSKGSFIGGSKRHTSTR